MSFDTYIINLNEMVTSRDNVMRLELHLLQLYTAGVTDEPGRVGIISDITDKLQQMTIDLMNNPDKYPPVKSELCWKWKPQEQRNNDRSRI
jgi:hypothetical protein